MRTRSAPIRTKCAPAGPFQLLPLRIGLLPRDIVRPLGIVVCVSAYMNQSYGSGSALNLIGDVTGDGIGDLAVGAWGRPETVLVLGGDVALF